MAGKEAWPPVVPPYNKPRSSGDPRAFEYLFTDGDQPPTYVGAWYDKPFKDDEADFDVASADLGVVLYAQGPKDRYFVRLAETIEHTEDPDAVRQLEGTRDHYSTQASGGYLKHMIRSGDQNDEVLLTKHFEADPRPQNPDAALEAARRLASQVFERLAINPPQN